MHGIGSLEEAEFIVGYIERRSKDYSGLRAEDGVGAPQGWEFLGAGCDRSVWGSPSGVAYKVPHNPDDQAQSENEISHLDWAWKLTPPEGCRIPQFDSFWVNDILVVAMEVVRGECLYRIDDNADLRRLARICQEVYGLRDLHTENVMLDTEGVLVPVDFGL